MGPVDAGTYSPLVLAYIGDAVYEVMIRAKVVNKGSIQVNKLHKKSAELVKAGTQAAMIHLLEEDLTAQEHAVYKRGRNAKSFTMAKHATMADYRTATGFEMLYFHLLFMKFSLGFLLFKDLLLALTADGRNKNLSL